MSTRKINNLLQVVLATCSYTLEWLFASAPNGSGYTTVCIRLHLLHFSEPHNKKNKRKT